MRAGVKRRDERGVGDVVAERIKPNLARLERDVGRAQGAPRSVDDADGLERRRLVRKPLPDVKRLQKIDGACEERGGPRLDRAARGAGAGPITTVSAPTCASASAATSPEGPVPTTATSCNWPVVAIVHLLRVSSATRTMSAKFYQAPEKQSKSATRASEA